MERVLQIVDSMEMGGIQAFIMNVYRSIDREQIQFDFLVHHMTDGPFYQEIEARGGKVYCLPARNEGVLKNKTSLREFFNEHKEYRVVHMHESSLSYIEPLVAAKNAGVPIRIMHSHNTRIPGSKLHIILHRLHSLSIHKVATHYLACGEMAGKWMYGNSRVKDYTVLYNGISLESFKFNPDIRKQVRNELAVGDALVFGHVGRFMQVKNHKFLVDVFKEILKMQPDSYLVLAGTGELLESTKEYCRSLDIIDRVKFLGVRKDVSRLVQAMDAMIMPSFFEGFPVTAIEAQASGLPVYLSGTITKEAVIKENVHVIDLNCSAAEWAKTILDDLRRLENNDVLYEKGFDIYDVASKLLKLYRTGVI